MKVEIPLYLGALAEQEYKKAYDRYRQAVASEFYSLMRKGNISLGQKVVIRRGGYSYDAIFVGTENFAKIKKNGKASLRMWRLTKPYTVEKAP